MLDHYQRQQDAAAAIDRLNAEEAAILADQPEQAAAIEAASAEAAEAAAEVTEQEYELAAVMTATHGAAGWRAPKTPY